VTAGTSIERVRVLPVTLEIRHPLRFTQGRVRKFQRIIVELTSRDGVVGYGECRGDPLIHTMLTGLAGSLIGTDPYQLERLRWRIAPQGLVELFSGTVAVQCFAAIEMACLDLAGRTTGRPVSDLLGGRVRDAVTTAGYLYYGDAPEAAAQDELLALAHEMDATYGFRTLKFKCGVFTPETELATLRRLRAEFPGHRIRIDPNGAWGIATSLRFLAAARELGVEYVEDPAPTLAKNRRIRELDPGVALASNQAVASLETMGLDQAFGAIDIVLVDVNWYGGLRGSVLAGRMAELVGRDVNIHSSHETAISQAAQLHAAACIANLPYAADTHYGYLGDDVIAGAPLPAADGAMPVPEGPGLGVDVDPQELDRLHARWQELGFLSWNEDDGEPVVLPRW
jgi:glucarate dehydratase